MTTTETEIRKHETTTPERAHMREEGRVYTPDVDIIEKKDGIELLADMPGVDEKSLDITFEDRVLTIAGHVHVGEAQGGAPVCGEYGVGDYRRSFTVSGEIDAERIEATLKDGVLRLRLPKIEAARARKIDVKTEG